MLVELHIENLGVIESLVLPIHEGFTVLTGETGAGKTMLLEAISLVVGGRADASMVRAGAAEARVEAVFHVKNPATLQIGAESDLDVSGLVEDAAEVIVTRVIPVDGRSRAYLNNRPVTVSLLSDIGRDLVDIHGQHAHQKLLSAAAQREALDQFGKVDLSRVQDVRRRLVETEASMAALGGDERSRAREIDLLTFQAREIESAAIAGETEESELAIQEETLGDAVNIREAMARAIEFLSSDSGARDQIGSALAALGSSPVTQEYRDRLSSLFAELDDVITSLRDSSENIEDDPEKLKDVRERRQLLRDLMKKYGDSLADVIVYGAQTRERLNELLSYSQRITELEDRRRELLTELAKEQKAVGKKRRSAAKELSEVLTDRVKTLAMEHAEIVVQAGASAEDLAADEVTFLLSANPGSPLLPLTKVASGGELSRTMLALQLTLTSAPETMIFDEVDAGIGGSAAVTVAQALAELGHGHQVLAVTHMPQMAATAHHHIQVSKEVVNNSTFGRAHALTDAERVEELARMLSGGIANDAARAHAKEMLSPKGQPKRRSGL